MATPVKFYADEHIARAVVLGLRARGADVVTAVEADLLGATDDAQLEHARIEGRTLLTQDADFLRLHDAGAEHAGIVYAMQGTSIGDVIRGSMLIHQVLDAQDMVEHVEFIRTLAGR